MSVTMEDFLSGAATKQQVFDFTMGKLLEQGVPSMSERSGSCLYNDGDGHHCALGWLLLGRTVCEDVTPIVLLDSAETRSIPELCDRFELRNDQADVLAFLDDLQSVHDRAARSCRWQGLPFHEELRARGRAFARDYKLDASVLAEGADE